MNSNRDYATENINLKKRLEALEKENQDLWQQIETYNHKFAEVERKKADLTQQNEKLKKAIQNFIEWVEKQLEQIEQIVNTNKGTYTNIVELSVLNDILDKLKEVLEYAK